MFTRWLEDKIYQYKKAPVRLLNSLLVHLMEDLVIRMRNDGHFARCLKGAYHWC